MSGHQYCTLFESNYLPRGLVMLQSLLRADPAAAVRVYCMDVVTERVLSSLQLKRIDVVTLRELEDYDPALAAVRPLRTLGEYCWTATPSVCLHSLDRSGAQQAITYLDADLEFYSDPQALFAEQPDASILLTAHRYSQHFYDIEAPDEHPELAGVFNVQFVSFHDDANGRAALTWWRERCLEWCHDRIEQGRYGDQRYLDDWPERFAGVHVLEHVGGGLAPWNASQYRLTAGEYGLLVDSSPLIFHHYQSLRLHAATALGRAAALRWPTHGRISGVCWSVVWSLSSIERELLWNPYVERVVARIDELQSSGFSRDYWFHADYRDIVRLRGLRARARRLLS